MEVKASAKYIRMSPRKVRLVTDLIKGSDVNAALTKLEFTTKAAVSPVMKLLKSAASNAKENFKLELDNLFVKDIKVNGGPVLKRWMPRAFGRATPLLKRSSHIHIVLAEKNPTDDKKIAAAKQKEDKDDLLKVGSLEEIKSSDAKKGDKKSQEKTEKLHTKKVSVNKIFNRKSGEK